MADKNSLDLGLLCAEEPNETDNVIACAIRLAGLILTSTELPPDMPPLYDGDAIDFEVICGNDAYACNKAALMTRSPYFQIVLNTPKVSRLHLEMRYAFY